MTKIHIQIGQIVHERRRPAPGGAAIVIGPSKVPGQLRICRWRGAHQHWRGATTVDAKQLVPIVDWTVMPLTEAKRLASAVFERGYLARAMDAAGGSMATAAAAAGVDRSNFRRLLQRHGLVKLSPPKRKLRWKKARRTARRSR